MANGEHCSELLEFFRADVARGLQLKNGNVTLPLKDTEDDFHRWCNAERRLKGDETMIFDKEYPAEPAREPIHYRYAYPNCPEKAYERAYQAEYGRVYEASVLARLQGDERKARLLFWARIAHTAGFIARERAEQATESGG